MSIESRTGKVILRASITADEYREIRQAALAANLSTSEYVAYLIRKARKSIKRREKT